MRTKLTKTKAQQLLRARVAAGMSQYELAEELGWVRSKIKRIEKGEVSSIDEEDLERLEEALDVQESSAPAPKKRSSNNVITLPRGKSDGLFEVLRKVERPGRGANQVFFRVRMKVSMAPGEMLGRAAEIRGYEGSINGVENGTDQDPLELGDEVVIMVWGPGIAQRPGARTSSSA